MNRKTILLIIFISSQFTVWAQKEYNIWYFGNKAGLNFNTIPVSPLTDSRMYTFQSSTSMCDSSGNLLFYTSGDSIYNRQHKLMLNWKSGRPYAQVFSAAQGAMALPVPGIKQLYYVFNGLSYENVIGLSKDSMLRYFIIDMKGDGGLGAVVIKDQPLLKARSENFAVTIHANGFDYWVGAIDDYEGNFNCIRTTNGQFTAPVIKQKLNPKPDQFSQFIKFSPDSKILYSKESIKNQNLYMNLYKFDNSSGQLSQHISLFIGDKRPNGATYLEFSPNSKFFYRPMIEGTLYNLYQYDISMWDSAAINSSKQLIFSFNINSPGFFPFSHLQLGPDGKIYCFHYQSDKISVINDPDLKGSNCNYSLKTIDLAKRKNQYGGPYYPTFWFRNWKINIGNDTTICLGDSVKLKCNVGTRSIIKWNTGDTTKNIIVRKQGVYSVQVTSPFGITKYDTIVIKVGSKFKVYIGSDTAFCGKFSYLLKANTGFMKYKWNMGDTTMQVTVNSKGIYSVKVIDSTSCPSADTIAIDEIAKPLIKLRYDSITCKYAYLSIDSLSGLTYLWNTGETNTSIKTSKDGLYTVKASHKFCSNSDSIFVKIPSYLCEEMIYFIPNAFSPNGDKGNDVFKVFGTNIDQVEIIIFDRWGEKLIETSGKDPSWDGTYKNAPCQQSAYFYMVTLKGKKPGSIKYLKGMVTLLK